jgi:tRNA-2-methylthio-N6-dimethylallyladenosine synthase
VDIAFPEIEKFDRLPPARVEGPGAFVSIMEGCSKYCSFCVVPYTRGEEVSRPLDDVLTEIADLAERGVKEVTLLGQNVNAYRGRMADGEVADLALLIEYVAELPGIGRIRYTTSHPNDMDDALIAAHAGSLIGKERRAGYIIDRECGERDGGSQADTRQLRIRARSATGQVAGAAS